VVRDWPGIEISAFDYLLSDSDIPPNPYISENRIQTMRQEKLSDTVMLCIFNGTPSHVRIQEPYEGMRVGVDTGDARHDNGRAYRTNLKDLDANFLCRICGGSVNTADADPQCEDPLDIHDHVQNVAQCPKCYKYIYAPHAEAGPCPYCPLHPGIWLDKYELDFPSTTLTANYRTYDVFTRRQPGDNSVLNIQGIYEKGLEQLDYIQGSVPPQDSALLAIQLLQFPYQQDFECENDYPKSVNTNPTDTSGGA
jgi:Zn-finger nucleic acid-binding protein